MPGLVGYSVCRDTEKRKPLEDMIKTMGNFCIDKFYGRLLHVAHVHLGIFNKETQPAWSEDKRFGIMFYGKIYGYGEELKKLQAKGHDIEKTDNDAEFVIHAFEEFGKDALHLLNGSYAFSIFDEDEEKIFLVSDRFGTRPLYYALNDGNLLFASTVKAILKYPYPKILNEKTLVKFFRYGKLGILGDETWFEGIRVLPSASFLEFHRGNLRIEKYWDINYIADHGRNIESVVNELVDKFRKAVNIRLQDNIKYGLSLSGGLDSRAVLGGE